MIVTRGLGRSEHGAIVAAGFGLRSAAFTYDLSDGVFVRPMSVAPVVTIAALHAFARPSIQFAIATLTEQRPVVRESREQPAVRVSRERPFIRVDSDDESVTVPTENPIVH